MQDTAHSLKISLKRHNSEEVEIVWKAVLSIAAFRQDLFKPHIIILEIRTEDGNWEIDEADCGGFAVFFHVLSKHLAGIQPLAEWWPVVTNPLSREEEVCIYQRSDKN